MKNLVVNAGSSSLKFQVFDEENSIISGLIEEIGSERSKIKLKENGEKSESTQSIQNHKEAFSKVLEILKERNLLDEIQFVSHRIIHGGEKFKESVLIDDDAVKEMEKLIDLAPLHYGPHLEGVKIMRELLPKAKHFGIFDTAYHSTMPEASYLYAVPYEWYKKYGVRKYGFHGTSHKYVVGKTVELIKKENSKVISCHLGNGASICAAVDGKSFCTSMGLTPLEGLMMGTRSGSLDPAIIKYISEKENLSIKEVDNILNKKSGLLGVSEISSDMREIEKGLLENSPGAKRAFNLFCHKLIEQIGAYIAVIGGVDAIVFTGGIGEKGFLVREFVANHLKFLGLEIDEEKNNSNFVGEISKENSKVKIYVIPTNEELQMTLDAKELLKKLNN